MMIIISNSIIITNSIIIAWRQQQQQQQVTCVLRSSAGCKPLLQLCPLPFSSCLLLPAGLFVDDRA